MDGLPATAPTASSASTVWNAVDVLSLVNKDVFDKHNPDEKFMTCPADVDDEMRRCRKRGNKMKCSKSIPRIQELGPEHANLGPLLRNLAESITSTRAVCVVFNDPTSATHNEPNQPNFEPVKKSSA
ncbi:uncharacterized protein BDZ99DRAFT_525398 [Mytilinidion resinicola]|uniref:Uncharacterized protein n=1 Tax=Mytilinidion resinicola TaxID=574789 RepID=A0A6A6Y7Q3_9PEZI|nr:uncharacterized protein BDZ99DRAFT_525398 [Mytilinidion resinicola]KAF2804563.1 hypothetical protein BDZ99DRAFT_525398 [Mytilinidion resinicola]